MDQIRFLCGKHQAVEWSGVLFYDAFSRTIDETKLSATPPMDALFDVAVGEQVPGYEFTKLSQTDLFNQLHDPSKEILLLARAVFPRDIGTAGYTEFSYDMKKIFDMFEKWPESETMLRGMIHSHNNMGVFFSGTDNDQLKDGAASHTNFLSLIVNNRMEMVAQISTEGEISKSMNVISKTNMGFAPTTEVKEKVTFSNTINILRNDVGSPLPQWFVQAYEDVVASTRHSYRGTGNHNWVSPKRQQSLFGEDTVDDIAYEEDWPLMRYSLPANKNLISKEDKRTVNEMAKSATDILYTRQVKKFVDHYAYELMVAMEKMDNGVAYNFWCQYFNSPNDKHQMWRYFGVLGINHREYVVDRKNEFLLVDDDYVKTPIWIPELIEILNFMAIFYAATKYEDREVEEIVTEILFDQSEDFSSTIKCFLILSEYLNQFVSSFVTDNTITHKLASWAAFLSGNLYSEIINPLKEVDPKVKDAIEEAEDLFYHYHEHQKTVIN